MRAALYLRVSTDEQAASAEEQERGALAWCARHGHEVVARFRDIGLSGAEWKHRSGVLELERQAKLTPRPFDLVCIRDADRLGRDGIRLPYLLSVLGDHGVKVVTWSTGEVLAVDDGMGSLIVGVRASVAQMQREGIAHATKTSLKTRAERGLCVGGRPYGYRLERGPEGVRYVVDDVEAAVVREIYQRRAAGQSARAVAGDLNRRGVASARWKAGALWHPTAINKICASARYRGVGTWGRTGSKYRGGTKVVVTHGDDAVITYPVPPIVDDTLWQRAQTNTVNASKAKGAIVHRGTTPKYLMIGNGTCGFCGGPLGSTRSSVWVDGSPTHVPAYTCGRARDQSACRFKARRRVERIDEPVLDWLLNEVLNPDVVREGLAKASAAAVVATSAGPDPRIPAQRAVVANLEARVAKLVNAVEITDDPGVLTALQGRRAELNAAQRDLDELERLAVPVAPDDGAELLAFLSDARPMFEGAREERPDLLRAVLGAVLVGPIVVTPEGSGRALMLHLKGEAKPGAVLDMRITPSGDRLQGLQGQEGVSPNRTPPGIGITPNSGMSTTPGARAHTLRVLLRKAV